ncbi:helix-turn-helix transcriptional regulator [Ruegeria pomeroyi]|uniref:Winged helix-turn-helix transcriptional regulator n=1 Tax=Ruegeria alba TaxID=2916756 RepID=A0ABS9NR21_9RHOB|nr:winged helix-turn-helix transcriptional regulator [Ruegeria alba]MCE8518173.1 helix-turn-helix transcriptional regulator [Ruegeria pomeroyi]MCG6556680.1 winged helix-turn-helix transcriptional regulator [Ruegeria alba]
MDINLLVKLTARAWSLPILANLHQGVAGRQAPLLAATGAGRTAFAASLAHLLQLGLLERNPGHGHPLRPEFRLTASGQEAAALAARLLGTVPGAAEGALLRRSWTVPILALTGQPRRFSAIRSDLSPITDRALSVSLKQLEDHEWLRRDLDLSQRVPFPVYRAANLGAELNRAIGLEGA